MGTAASECWKREEEASHGIQRALRRTSTHLEQSVSGALNNLFELEPEEECTPDAGSSHDLRRMMSRLAIIMSNDKQMEALIFSDEQLFDLTSGSGNDIMAKQPMTLADAVGCSQERTILLGRCSTEKTIPVQLEAR